MQLTQVYTIIQAIDGAGETAIEFNYTVPHAVLHRAELFTKPR